MYRFPTSQYYLESQQRIRITVLLGLFVSVTLWGQQKQYYFQSLTPSDGLPSGQVLSILEDSTGELWLGTMGGLVRYDGYNFKNYKMNPFDSMSISDVVIHALTLDLDGNIWVGTKNGLNKWIRSTDQFKRYMADKDQLFSIPANRINSLLITDHGDLLVATSGGLVLKKQHSDLFLPILSQDQSTNDLLKTVSILKQDPAGYCWAGTPSGILQIDLLKKSFLLIPFDMEGIRNINQNTIWDIYHTSNNNLLVASDEGVFFYNTDETLLELANYPFSQKRKVKNIVEDRTGNLWFGYLEGGLIKLNTKTNVIRQFKHKENGSFGPSSERIHALFLDKFDNLWIGGYNGLDKLRLADPKFSFYQLKPNSLPKRNMISNVYIDENNIIWIQNSVGELFISTELGTSVKKIETDFINPDRVIVSCLTVDSRGQAWISTANHGFLSYNTKEGIARKSHAFPDLEGVRSYQLEEDFQNPGLFWMSTEYGLAHLDFQLKKLEWYFPKAYISDLESNTVKYFQQLDNGEIIMQLDLHHKPCLGILDKTNKSFRKLQLQDTPNSDSEILLRGTVCSDDGKIVWMATNLGLASYHVESDKLRLTNELQELIGNALFGITKDLKGNLWLKGLKSITRYNPNTLSSEVFPVEQDMQEFNVFGSASDKNGRLYFNGNRGLYVAFHRWTSPKMPLAIPLLTNIMVDNQTKMFKNPIAQTKKVVLQAHENSISFEFVAVHHTSPNLNKYRYRLIGFNEKWIESQTDRKATYTNLNPGNYRFEVMVAGWDGQWNHKDLINVLLVVQVPWFRSWWAISFYIMFVTLGVFLSSAFLKQKNRERREQERLRSLDKLKTKLYTDITHDFRSPLMVIESLLSNISGNDSPKTKIKHNLAILSKMLDQMLDLSLLKSEYVKLNPEEEDIILALSTNVEAFHALATTKNINLTYYSKIERHFMEFDREKLKKVMNNLLSNAIKFTPEYGEIKVITEFSKTSLEIQVIDTGYGIPADKVPYIFNRFYRAQDLRSGETHGTGVGLAITKELVDLMGGSIDVKSTLNKGTTFKILLPLGTNQESYIYNNTDNSTKMFEGVKMQEFESSANQSTHSKPRVLIVEDNQAVVESLVSYLNKKYHLDISSDGIDGFDKLVHFKPEIVICDVLMPNKDGFEFCLQAKQDQRTFHIPIILLTGKASLEDRLAGLSIGADSYMVKPVNKEELLLCIANLLSMKEKIKKFLSLTDETSVLAESDLFSSTEFLRQARRVVLNHIEDETFSVEVLAKKMHRSKSTLTRNFRELTDLTPGYFIQATRLTKAKQLIETTNLPIKEIAALVGFKHHNHFSSTFKSFYGDTPSDTRK